MNEKLHKTEPYPVDAFVMAQTDLRKGYADGSLGVLILGAVWLVAALVAFFVSSLTAVWTLFFGGMYAHQHKSSAFHGQFSQWILFGMVTGHPH